MFLVFEWKQEHLSLKDRREGFVEKASKTPHMALWGP